MSALVATVVPWLNRPTSASSTLGLADAREHAVDRIGGRRDLGDVEPAGLRVEQAHVGERPADVDGDDRLD